MNYNLEFKLGRKTGNLSTREFENHSLYLALSQIQLVVKFQLSTNEELLIEIWIFWCPVAQLVENVEAEFKFKKQLKISINEGLVHRRMNILKTSQKLRGCKPVRMKTINSKYWN